MTNYFSIDEAMQRVRLMHRDTGGYIGFSAIYAGQPMPFSKAFPNDADLTDRAGTWLTARETRTPIGLYVRQSSMFRIPEKRGVNADSLALAELWADLDTESPAHKHQVCEGGEACTHPSKKDGAPHGEPGFQAAHGQEVYRQPAGLDESLKIVAEAGYEPPSLLQASGNGFYGHWCLTEPIDCERGAKGPGTAADLSRRWHAELSHAARRIELDYGKGISDLARVLRLSGTLNRKEGTPGGEAQSKMIDGGTGRRFTVDELWAMLERAEAKTAAWEANRKASPGPDASRQSTTRDEAPTGARQHDRPKLSQENSPQTDFNRRADWLKDILLPAGWTVLEDESHDGEIAVIRPGGSSYGQRSGTVNWNGNGNLHIFSSNAAPFEGGENYTPSMAWRILHHGGETGDPTWSKTNKDLRAMGYGDPLPPRTKPDAGDDDRRQEPGVDGSATTSPGLPVLPEEFWTARPYLTQIREVAHGQAVSADVALSTVLARLSAMLPPRARAHSGIRGKRGASLNLFVAVYDGSGAGKSSSFDVANDLLACPLTAESFPDGVSVGSGQGIAELFMDEVEVQEPDTYDEETGKPKKGRKKAVRKQVRNNAFIYVDEGQSLTAQMQTTGSLLGSTLRSAATGATLGQANATKDRYRFVPAGTYALGMVVGFQRSTVGPLIGDAVAGTPQRFLWVSAADPNIPDEAEPVDHVIRWDPSAVGPAGISIAPTIRARLRAGAVAKQRGEAVIDQLDSQQPVMLIKIAALLAILDKRVEVDESDWALAETVWATSSAVRSAVVNALASDGRESARQRSEVKAAEAVAVQRSLREDVDDTLARIAKVIARCVHKAGADGLTRGYVRRGVATRDHPRFTEALAFAVEADWVAVEGQRVKPSESMPSD